MATNHDVGEDKPDSQTENRKFYSMAEFYAAYFEWFPWGMMNGLEELLADVLAIRHGEMMRSALRSNPSGDMRHR